LWTLNGFELPPVGLLGLHWVHQRARGNSKWASWLSMAIEGYVERGLRRRGPSRLSLALNCLLRVCLASTGSSREPG
jgi:hypothetical protein